MYDNCSIDVDNTSGHTCLRLNQMIRIELDGTITIINYNTRTQLVKGRLKWKDNNNDK